MLLSPRAKGTFERAIAMSGSPKIDQTLEDAHHANAQVLGKTGCLLKEMGECLRAVPPRKLLRIAPWDLWNVNQMDMPTRHQIMGPLVFVDGNCKEEGGVDECEGVVTQSSWSAFRSMPVHKPTWAPTIIMGSMTREIATQPALHLKTASGYEALVRERLAAWDGAFGERSHRYVIGRDGRVNGSLADEALRLYPPADDAQDTYEEMATDLGFFCGLRELAAAAMFSGQATTYLYRNGMRPLRAVDYGAVLGMTHSSNQPIIGTLL